MRKSVRIRECWKESLKIRMISAKSLFTLCAVVSVTLLIPDYALHAYQAPAKPDTEAKPVPEAHSSPAANLAAVAKPNYDPPPNLARTDLPAWPYPKGVHIEATPDDGKLYRIPGSSKTFTDTQINRLASSPDWFPDSHPTPPAPVITGKEGAYRACGECHLMNGAGKPDTARLQGLPVTYFLQQLEDMKNDKRHASVVRASITSMIPIAKSIDAADAKLAAEYFHSLPPFKSVRVVETDTVPVTHPGPHSVQLVERGATEPIGTRIIEIPEDAERTLLRDPSSGFIAYVPLGSIKRGEALARIGADKTGAGKTGAGKTIACTTCHGPNLKGMGDQFPGLAGASPTVAARQLYDFKSGTRDGKNAAAMKSVVATLTDQDIVDVAAYLASLQP